ncbi:MAG: aldehyde dehydrogenase family protein [Scytolyngbya sp. HA4215-MV1]|jgi:acyl-CoA reductase-like NAD-dependent aldehyde dehydrogenase|nr:aldehyde dehydrogenase family protein [Scytolyngbya sp. HA4215-MV1]
MLETPRPQVDNAIAALSDRKNDWLTIGIPERIAYLRDCLAGVKAIAEDWVKAACAAKGIAPDAPLAGEEWIAGPVATLWNLRLLIKTLVADGQPTPVAVEQKANHQTVVQIFPDNLMDRLLFLGFRGEIWLEPGKPATQGLVYRQRPSEGKLALILGAGNVSSIAPADTLYKLFAEDQVVLLKMNPVNEYMGALLEQAFAPLITDGFLNIVYGGAELGSYLCQHPDIESIHITGSHHTHDAIVWGSPSAEQQQRQTDHTPRLTKPISSELGCVTPILVVPGNWSKADMTFQARHIAGMVAHNASFNCVAAKVVVTAKGWHQREEFLQQLYQQLAKTPSRQAYYPGAQQRYQAFLDRYPQANPLAERTETIVPWTMIPDVPPAADEYALQTEAFCGVLAEVSLEAENAKSFLAQATEFVNQHVWGNLSCILLVDPTTQRRVAAELQTAIAQLRYGVIGVNTWTGAVYLMGAAPWGAFPGNSLDNIQSGVGVVHNTYLFEHPQKVVVYAPFHIIPTPVWFADHKNLLQLAQRFALLQAAPDLGKFIRVVVAAFKG